MNLNAFLENITNRMQNETETRTCEIIAYNLNATCCIKRYNLI